MKKENKIYDIKSVMRALRIDRNRLDYLFRKKGTGLKRKKDYYVFGKPIFSQSDYEKIKRANKGKKKLS